MDFITLKNITKTFDGVDVLKDINLKINEGETLGILGRSGSGKSVLINMLRGTLDYKPDAGNIIMNIAVCPDCLAVDSPSHVGEKCVCGATLEAKGVENTIVKCDKEGFLNPEDIRKAIKDTRTKIKDGILAVVTPQSINWKINYLIKHLKEEKEWYSKVRKER